MAMDIPKISADGARMILESLFIKVAPDMVEPDRQFVAGFPNWETQYTWESCPNSCDTPNNLMNFEMFWGIVRSEEGEDLYNLFEYELGSYIDFVHEEMHQNLKRNPFESFEKGLIDFNGPFARIDVEYLARMAVKVYEEYLASK
jgi:hypothetical protein